MAMNRWILNKWIVPFWALGCILALAHLLWLGAYEVTVGSAIFSLVLLVCYSVPFFLLMRLSVPAEKSLQRYFLLALCAVIILTSLAVPLLRFRPGYKPSALESLVYLFYPFIEVCMIGGVILLADLARRVFAKRES